MDSVINGTDIRSVFGDFNRTERVESDLRYNRTEKLLKFTKNITKIWQIWALFGEIRHVLWPFKFFFLVTSRTETEPNGILKNGNRTERHFRRLDPPLLTSDNWDLKFQLLTVAGILMHEIASRVILECDKRRPVIPVSDPSGTNTSLMTSSLTLLEST